MLSFMYFKNFIKNIGSRAVLDFMAIKKQEQGAMVSLLKTNKTAVLYCVTLQGEKFVVLKLPVPSSASCRERVK